MYQVDFVVFAMILVVTLHTVLSETNGESDKIQRVFLLLTFIHKENKALESTVILTFVVS